MRSSTLALSALASLALSAPHCSAFTPSSLSVGPTRIAYQPLAFVTDGTVSTARSARNTSLSMAGPGGAFMGQDDDEDDDEDDDDDDDDDDDSAPLSARRRALRAAAGGGGDSALAGLKLDPHDPNPPIKPRPGRYGFGAVDAVEAIPDGQLAQTMGESERGDNLEVMRQIKKSDLADLRLRKDHAGWVEANNDLKRRTLSDPWFGLNDRLNEAVLSGEDEQANYLTGLIAKMGGPPPGVTIAGDRGYALHTEIYDVKMTSSRAASLLQQEVIEDQVKRGRAMAAEARANQEKGRRRFEEKRRGGGDNTEEKEARERRERMMTRIMGELEEDKKKSEERAKELLGKMPDMPTDITGSFDRALKDAREDVKDFKRREKLGDSAVDLEKAAGASTDDDDDEDGSDSSTKSSAARAREQAAQGASGGRPRVPGDSDVTLGEITVPTLQSSSVTSGPLTVEVNSGYNAEQSDPPMRKHCFQYTVKITNNSPTDTIQLLSRRFEIQTVGSSMKDVVQGEGVTGRQPLLKPGEVFEYTSTAPLSVRPIGTTITAARMSGEYRYVVLTPGQDTATPEQVKDGGDSAAQLGTFHFVFPEEQRVKPVTLADDDDDDEDEEDDDDDVVATSSSSSSSSSAAPARGGPSSTLPGDRDMESGEVRPSDPAVDDTSDSITDGVRVRVTTSYKPDRSDPSLDKHCFQYNIRITNEGADQSIQLVSRRFEIQTVGSGTKDVVQGPGVTGRQPILKPGESFEYNSTAPLSVKPMLDRTPVVARMEGEYNFVILGDDGVTPVSSTPLQAKLGRFHFILPALGGV